MLGTQPSERVLEHRVWPHGALIEGVARMRWQSFKCESTIESTSHGGNATKPIDCGRPISPWGGDPCLLINLRLRHSVVKYLPRSLAIYGLNLLQDCRRHRCRISLLDETFELYVGVACSLVESLSSSHSTQCSVRRRLLFNPLSFGLNIPTS